MKRLLQRPDFRRLIVGQTASAFGDWLATVAFMALVLELTSSSTAVAGILVLRLAPAVVAGPVATRLVRRWDRKRLMLAMDLVRAGIVAVVPFVSALWWVYMWAFILEVASLVFLPARDSAIPDLVEDGDDLDAANGLVLASSYATIPLGAGAFGAVAATSPAGSGILAVGPAFWVDAVTFLVSFEMIRRVRGIGGREEREERVEAPLAGLGVPSDDAGGFFEAFRIPLVRAIMPAVAAASLGIGALFSLGIVFVREVLGASDPQFGVLVALFGVGAGIGLFLLRVSRAEGVAAVRLAVFVQGSVISLMSLAPNIELTFLGATAFGAGAAASLAGGMTFLQNRLRGDPLTLAFTGFHIMIRAGLALAAIGAGVAADVIDGVDWPGFGVLEPTRLVLFFSGLVVVLGAVLARNVERVDAGSGVPGPGEVEGATT